MSDQKLTPLKALAGHQRQQLYKKRARDTRDYGTEITPPGADLSKREQPSLKQLAIDVERIPDDAVGRALHGDQYGRDTHLPMPKGGTRDPRLDAPSPNKSKIEQARKAVRRER